MFRKLKEKLKGEDSEQSGNQQHQHPQQKHLHPSNPYYVTPPKKKQHTNPSPETYHPRPGPPPNHAQTSSSSVQYTPPPGPPPSHQSTEQPPSYHNWQVIPDTALLPPPPSIGYDSSPAANASFSDSEAAADFCRRNPLWPPQSLTPAQHASIQSSHLSLLKPPSFKGDLLPQPRPGHWKCLSNTHCTDSSILTSLPAYSAQWDSPLRTQRPKTIYFELKVTGIGGEWDTSSSPSFIEAESGIAIGYVAPPYPSWRLPGWQRGSLAVHGDDGRKYVNDTYGGVDFTAPFSVGETVGVGVTFRLPVNPPSYDQTSGQAGGEGSSMLDVEVFFTRNGIRQGGWDGNEELDERCEGGAVGLKGECDLFPAVGVYGAVDWEVFFSPENWKYNPF